MSDSTFVIALIYAFCVKHFLCDFLLQPPYMYLNKGNWKHPGGYIHALFHAWTTVIILGFALHLQNWTTMLFGIALFEFVCHYVIDFTKVNLGKAYNLKPTNSEMFWVLLGLDQLLHMATYLIIVAYIVK
jgi:hypothetical protein